MSFCVLQAAHIPGQVIVDRMELGQGHPGLMPPVHLAKIMKLRYDLREIEWEAGQAEKLAQKTGGAGHGKRLPR